MGTMKYRVGDKVRIKSLDWYNKNKGADNVVHCGNKVFDNYMSVFCGSVVTIGGVYSYNGYDIREDIHCRTWTDEMIEGLVEKEIKPKFKVGDKITNGEITFTILTLSSDRYGAEDTFGECGSVCFKSQDEWKIVEEKDKPIDFTIKGTDTKGKVEIVIPEGYGYVVENGKLYFITKKKEYPKTYEECCRVLGVSEFEYNHTATNVWYRHKLMATLDKLMLCRDAYWKLFGDEMGLGKPWEPDWKNNLQHKHYISAEWDEIKTNFNSTTNKVLAFPTEEMRDAFKENFDRDIELCKELL